MARDMSDDEKRRRRAKDKRAQRIRDKSAGIAEATIRMPIGDVSHVRAVAARRLQGDTSLADAWRAEIAGTNSQTMHGLFERVTEQTPPEAQDRASDAPERLSAPPSPLRHGTTPRPPLEPPEKALAPSTAPYPTQRPTTPQRAPRRRFTAADLAARFTAKRVPPPELPTDGEGTNREEVLFLSRLHKEGP